MKRIEELKKRYKEVYLWEDKPNKIYEKHSHAYEVRLEIIHGGMKLIIESQRHILRKNSKIVIEKNKSHEAKISSKGCKYLVAERLK